MEDRSYAMAFPCVDVPIPFETATGAEGFDAPQSPFFALLQVDGPEAALEHLDRAIRGRR